MGARMRCKTHQDIRNPSLATAGALRRIGGIEPGKPPAMPLHTVASSSPAAQARHVLALTAIAWCIAPASPHEVARRAPHGHVPLRVRRRLHATAVAALLPYAW